MILIRLWFVILILSLSACESRSESELMEYINQIKNRPPNPRIEPLPKVSMVETFTFPEQDKRRNPFKPVTMVVKKQNILTPDLTRPKQPLEQYPLDSLKFSGILQEGPIVWALIKLPGENGAIVRVKVGDYMGKNFGRIMQITDKSVKLEELIQVEGQWRKQETVLNLPVSE